MYLYFYVFTVVLFGNGFAWWLVTTGLQRSHGSGQGSSTWLQLSKTLLKQLTSAGEEGRLQHTTVCLLAFRGLYGVVPCCCKTVLRLTLSHWIRSVLDLSAEKMFWDCCHSDRSLEMRECFSMCLPPWKGGEDHHWQLVNFLLNLPLPSGLQCVQLNSEEPLSSCRPYGNPALSEGLFVLRSGCELMVWFRGFGGLELPSWWRKCQSCAKSAGALWDAKSLLSATFCWSRWSFLSTKSKKLLFAPSFISPCKCHVIGRNAESSLSPVPVCLGEKRREVRWNHTSLCVCTLKAKLFVSLKHMGGRAAKPKLFPSICKLNLIP